MPWDLVAWSGEFHHCIMGELLFQFWKMVGSRLSHPGFFRSTGIVSDVGSVSASHCCQSIWAGGVPWIRCAGWGSVGNLPRQVEISSHYAIDSCTAHGNVRELNLGSAFDPRNHQLY